MKKSDNHKIDLIQEWLESSSQEKAPDGFTHKVMTRIDLEPLTAIKRYNSPFSKVFRNTVLISFGSLLLLSIIFSIFDLNPSFSYSYFDWIPQMRIPEIKIPEFNIDSPIPYQYILYSIGSVFLLYLFDTMLRSQFSSEKKRRA